MGEQRDMEGKERETEVRAFEVRKGRGGGRRCRKMRKGRQRGDRKMHGHVEYQGNRKDKKEATR